MTKPGRKAVPPIHRFETKYEIDPATGCWLWTAGLDRNGYAKFSPKTGGWSFAHRWRWEFENGPVPVGLELDHLCFTPRCVNPAHLEPVTHEENMRRRRPCPGVRTRPLAETCIRGHRFTEDNTYYAKQGRLCRACCRIRRQRAAA